MNTALYSKSVFSFCCDRLRYLEALRSAHTQECEQPYGCLACREQIATITVYRRIKNMIENGELTSHVEAADIK